MSNPPAPYPTPSAPAKISRSSTVDSETFRNRRVLHRAVNLLTTKGHPVPAIAETIVQLETDPPPSPPMISRHRRAHANSVPDASSSTQKEPKPAAKISRRHSDGSQSLGLGGSIRRKLREVKDVSSYISRSKSRSKESRSAIMSASGSDRTDSTNSQPASPRSIASQSPAPVFSLPEPPEPRGEVKRSSSSGGHIKRHGRSYSDLLWKRPRVQLPEPDALYTVASPFADSTEAETNDLTSPSTVTSPNNEMAAADSGTSTGQYERSLPTIHEPEHTVQEVPPTPIDGPLSPLSPTSPSSAASDFAIPPLLLAGVPMLKVSAKKQKRYFFHLDADEGQIVWKSKKLRISTSSSDRI